MDYEPNPQPLTINVESAPPTPRQVRVVDAQGRVLVRPIGFRPPVKGQGV